MNTNQSQQATQTTAASTTTQQTQTTPPASASQSQGNQQQAAAIDYEKLIDIVNGKQTATEESVLKGYFKQKGLSKEEAETAMAEFKKAKEAKQPNVEEMQRTIAETQKAQLNTAIENKAMLLHKELGVELTTIPYLVKLADMSKVIADGKVDEEALKAALSKVIEDVPGLKQQASGEAANQGFTQIGAGKTNTQASSQQAKPVATKRWNRFNN